MITHRELFTLITEEPEITLQNRKDPYFFTRERIARNLLNYTLIDSYKKFNAKRTPYPFVAASSLRPGTMSNSKEFVLQNSALVILLNSAMPTKLRKHFRFREGNRLCKENIHEVAPDLPGLDTYKWPMRFSNHVGFDTLMQLLLPLDFALLVQSKPQPGETWPFELTHFHVKIERLLDNAIRGLAIYLNYLERGLYEQGEAFVDVLEKKFFEYFNFYHNASGRRSAAALAAQLLAREKIASTIYVSSQQTCRLTSLTTSSENENISIEQYILLNLADNDFFNQLKIWSKKQNIDIRKDFLLKAKGQEKVALFRVRFEHTEVGRPSPDGQKKPTLNPREKWIRVKDEALISVNPQQTASIGCSLVYRRTPQDVNKENVKI